MDDFWQACLDYFRDELPPQQYVSWIKPLECALEGDVAIVYAPNRLSLRWLRERYLERIQALADKHFPARGMRIEVALSNRPVSLVPSTPAVQDSAAPVAAHSEALEDASRLNPAFAFSSFVTGKANQMARAAAIQVSEHPGGSYNPLFIYGGVGLGKTHLLHAIGNLVREQSPRARIRYLHAEQYVSDLVRAVQHRSFEAFKRYYHSLDLLLIDDIQFFAGKDRTQEEFFYTFNALLETRKQVVITCDSFPREIAGMEDRLKTRFGSGLTVAVEPPDLEMRVAILLKKAASEHVTLSDEIAFFVAQNVPSNVRELEGALKRLLAYSRFSGEPITMETSREALKDLLAVRARQISIDSIQRTVADYYKIKVAEMYSKKRSRTIARPRQIAMALAKELTPLSLPDIGDAFGGRDHTTVLHACRKVNELRTRNADVNRDFDSLLQTLRG